KKPRRDQRAAAVDAFELGELGCIRLEQIRKPQHASFPLGRRHPRPRTGLERAARRTDRAIDVRALPLGRLCDLRSTRWIDDRELAALDRIDELSVDKDSVTSAQVSRARGAQLG